jgi:hypothetical protein
MVFEHPVVVDSDGNEEDIVGFGIETPERVVEQP